MIPAQTTRANINLARGTTWLASYYYGNRVRSDAVGAVALPNDALLRYYVPFDITGWTAKLEIKSWPSLTVIDTFVSVPQLTIVPLLGQIDVKIQTAGYDFDQAEYALEITSPGEDIIQMAQGTLTLGQDIVT